MIRRAISANSEKKARRNRTRPPPNRGTLGTVLSAAGSSGHHCHPGCPRSVVLTASQNEQRSCRVPEAVQVIKWSGRRDLNPGSLVPQTSALTKLGHVPSPFQTQIIAHDPNVPLNALAREVPRPWAPVCQRPVNEPCQQRVT